MLNLISSFKALAYHSWDLESFLVMLLACLSTTFFCFYHDNGQYIAAKLDFTIIGSAIIFPVTFIIGETFRKREAAIQRIADIKALVSQIYTGLLVWRWNGSGTDLGAEWEARVKATLVRIARLMVAVLSLPTWSTNRHFLTRRGQSFRKLVMAREAEILEHMTSHFAEMHYFVEDLKARGLPGNEASRINQFNYFLQANFESVLMTKTYRTPNIARAFIRCAALICPIFYGPYFSWVAGTIGNGGQTNFAFALCLTVLTVGILLSLVHVQRTMEDPFLGEFPGDSIDLKDELAGLLLRLDGCVVVFARRVVAHAPPVENTDACICLHSIEQSLKARRAHLAAS